MFWEEPKSNGLIEANFYTGEHFRDERNKKAFAEKVTDSLGDIASTLDAIQVELQKSTAATQSLGDVLAGALTPPGANGSTTPLERAYVAVVVAERAKTVSKLRKALSDAAGEEGSEEEKLRALKAAVQDILG